MRELEILTGMFNPGREWVGREKEKYKRIFSGREVPGLPICFGVSASLPFEDIKFNLKEQFEDPQKMAFVQIRAMLAAQKARSSELPCIRANLGTGFVCSLFGARQEVFDDKMPWVRTRPSRDEIKDMSASMFEDVSGKGLVPRAEEIYRLYMDLLGGGEFCYLPDTQGVLDIAHLVRGDEIFYDVYDDPAFVHHLMELCLAAYESSSRHIKKLIGEPFDSGMHGGMAMYNGGVRYCMDTSVLFSRQQVEEFELPYLRRALAGFGGGWVHFCGYAPHLVDMLVEVPEVRGVNPNYMASRPYDYGRDAEKILKAGKFLKAGPFKREEETVDDYFERVLEPLDRRAGLVFTPRGGGFRVEENEADRVKEMWLRAQAKMTG